MQPLPPVIFSTSGSFPFNLLKSTHILLLGGSPGLDFFGTMTTGDAQAEMLLSMMPALSRISISFFTQSWCFSGRVYGLQAIGGLSPVSIDIHLYK